MLVRTKNKKQASIRGKKVSAERIIRRCIREALESAPTRMPLDLEIPPDLQELSNAFISAGEELYVVGGAVRDALLNKVPKDYDLATGADPETVINITTQDPNRKVDLTGKSFGVVRVWTADGNEYEIATFRKDIGTGRRPDAVEFTSIEDDVKRRDLTINALFYDMATGEVVDYVGGIDDIKSGTVKAVGDPAERFQEDKLRILRAVRFAGRLGSDLDPETEAAILDDNDLTEVSPERIRDEFIKGIRSAQSSSDFLRLTNQLQLFPQVFPGLSVSLDGVSAKKDPTVQIALLLVGNNPNSVESTLRQMKYTNQEVSTIKFLHNFTNITPADAPKLKKEFNRVRISPDSLRDFTDAVGSPTVKAVDTFIKFAAAPPAANPKDLMSQGLSGSEIGDAMQSAEIEAYSTMLNEIKKYIRAILVEKELRGQKSKRTLYHIGPRPAEPKPKQRWQSQGQPEQEWERYWLSSPVKSGVFLTPNPTDIVQHHGVSGNVYAYKVPEWVIAKSGGIHRFDVGSEILIPEEVWNEAGKEIEFLGKTMSQQDLWDSVESSWTRDAKRKSTHSDRRESPDWIKAQASLSGLRATSHPEAAIKMMSQKEIEGALAEFENEYAQEGVPEVVKGPRDKKGLVIPHFGKQPSGKDKELIDLLKKHMKESVVRNYVRSLLMEVPLDDFGYVAPTKKDEPVIVRSALADYFKDIPQKVNVYVAHTDDLNWATHLPAGVAGQLPDHIQGRGTTQVTDAAGLASNYPQLAQKLDGSAINLLYVYPKTYLVSDEFVAGVSPHYIAHDLHHIFELRRLDAGASDKFREILSAYLDELLMYTLGPMSSEYKATSKALGRTGRTFGVNKSEARKFYSEIFPGYDFVSGEQDLLADAFAAYLKSGKEIKLGIPSTWKGETGGYGKEVDRDIQIPNNAVTQDIASEHSKDLQGLLESLLDPLVGKVGIFNAFGVGSTDTKRAIEASKEAGRNKYPELFAYFDDQEAKFQSFSSYDRKGRPGKALVVKFPHPAPGKDVWKIEDYAALKPDVVAKLSDLGFDVVEASTGFGFLGGDEGISLYLMPMLVSESPVQEYVRQLLKEDPMGFVHDLAASDKFGDQFFGGRVGKEAGREIKRAFNKNADHQFLSTLDTVHWINSPYDLEPLVGKGKDELSATMTLPGDSFDPAGLPYGLWIKGRITLATNEQDNMYSGFYGDYGAGYEGSEEEVAHRDRSSGRNKRPSVSKDYSRYGQLKRGNEYMEKMAREKIPYILDQSTWNPGKTSSNNEALVDNWRPAGIIVAKDDVVKAILSAAKKLAGEGGTPPSGNIAKDINYFSTGITQEIMLAALQLGIPVYDTSRTKLWSSDKQSLDEIAIRRIIREQLQADPTLSTQQPDLQERFNAFMAEYESMSKRNPIGYRGDRYWYMGEVDGAHCLVMTNLNVFDGAISFNTIQTVPPDKCEGKGFASNVMNRLVSLADKHQVPMSLDPVPFGQKTLGARDLKSWYKRAGFSPNKDRGGEYWREPQDA